jgi:hypothetical protein
MENTGGAGPAGDAGRRSGSTGRDNPSAPRPHGVSDDYAQRRFDSKDDPLYSKRVPLLNIGVSPRFLCVMYNELFWE